MKQTLNFTTFANTFQNSSRADQFSYEALELIFDYIEECDSDYEFDMIAICCEWAEEDAATLAQYYNFDSAELDDVVKAMQDATQVAGTTAAGAIVYVQF